MAILLLGGRNEAIFEAVIKVTFTELFQFHCVGAGCQKYFFCEERQPWIGRSVFVIYGLIGIWTPQKSVTATCWCK